MREKVTEKEEEEETEGVRFSGSTAMRSKEARVDSDSHAKSH